MGLHINKLRLKVNVWVNLGIEWANYSIFENLLLCTEVFNLWKLDDNTTNTGLASHFDFKQVKVYGREVIQTASVAEWSVYQTAGFKSQLCQETCWPVTQSMS